MLECSGFSDVVCRELRIDAPEPDLAEWEAMVERIRSRSEEVHICLLYTSEPRKQLSQYAPKISQIMIDPQKIGDVVGCLLYTSRCV